MSDEGETSVFVGVCVIQVTHSRDTYQDLVRLMEQHRAERAVQLSILRCWILLTGTTMEKVMLKTRTEEFVVDVSSL